MYAIRSYYEITGFFNSQYNKVDDYFHLKEENVRVHKINDSLINLLNSSFMKIDTGITFLSDLTPRDTVTTVRRYLARAASVVSNSVTGQKIV